MPRPRWILEQNESWSLKRREGEERKDGGRKVVVWLVRQRKERFLNVLLL